MRVRVCVRSCRLLPQRGRHIRVPTITGSTVPTVTASGYLGFGEDMLRAEIASFSDRYVNAKYILLLTGNG